MTSLCKLLVIGTLQLCPNTASSEIAIHSITLDAPEITGMSNPLFVGEANWILWKNKEVTWSLSLKHTSSIPTYERGYGLNTIGIKSEVKLR